MVESFGASVLIVEDEETLATGLRAALENERFQVVHCESGEAALASIEDDVPDILLCDIMLPGMDGISVLRQVKRDHPELPVILVTSKGTELDKVLGLEFGADDYITKPFSLRELIARVKARLRARPEAPKAPDRVKFGRNEVDVRRRILWRDGIEHRLTTHEAGVLAYLIAHKSSNVSREDLLKYVWGYSASMATRTVDNQVLKLRKRVEDAPADPRHILTVHGMGYRFEE
ncbi:MAG: response regulator transcription factor [Pseudomonadota bacterium]|nr:response regulator transcription factor [Pseudomonadota bacterium]